MESRSCLDFVGTLKSLGGMRLDADRSTSSEPFMMRHHRTSLRRLVIESCYALEEAELTHFPKLTSLTLAASPTMFGHGFGTFLFQHRETVTELVLTDRTISGVSEALLSHRGITPLMTSYHVKNDVNACAL